MAAPASDGFRSLIPVVDVVTSGISASPPVRALADRLNLDLRCHIVGPQHPVSQTHAFGIVIVEAEGLDLAIGLLLAELRDLSPACIILLLPNAGIELRVAARIQGADHVIDIDTDARELVAILRNELRRRSAPRVLPRAGEEDRHWHLDREKWTLIAPNGSPVRLTHSEFQLLDLLLSHAGQVQSRPALRAAIDGDPNCARVLDVVLSRLRRKVWDFAQMELPLRSARREGYVFASATPVRLSPE